MPLSKLDPSEKYFPEYEKVIEEADETKSCTCDGSEKDTIPAIDDELDPLTEDIPSQTDIVIPPDGGWGWVVVLSSFMCNLIVDGTIFSFGTFLEPIAEEFGVDKPDVTIVGSLMSGFYLIAGPFVSAIANRYGFRLVTIFGAVFSAAAFAISNFATSVPFLCVTYGILGGIGFGFIYAPSIIILGFYFERWRGLATGIAVCGSGIGTFIYAPVTKILIENLGWRHALLCHAALALSCVIYGASYRPLKPIKVDNSDEITDEPEYKIPLAAQIKMEAAIKMLKKRDSVSSVDHQSSIPRLLGVNNNSVYPRVSDVYHTICVPSGNITSRASVENKMSWTRERSKTEGKLQLTQFNKFKRTRFEKSHEVIRPLYRDDIFFTGSLARLPLYASKTTVEYNLAVTRLPTKNDIEEEETKTCKLCPEAFRRALATMLDVSLFKSPTFIVLAIGGFFTMMGFFVPYLFLLDRANEAHFGSSAVWLVSTIGITNTIGRVGYGLICSIPKTNALVIINIALTVGGIATMLSGLSMSMEYQFSYSVIFGLSVSSFASIRSIAVVDLLGLEKLTNAFGLLLMFQGIAAIIGAPLAGAFQTLTGSYNACFYLSGGVLLFSAILCYPLNWINAWEKRKLQEKGGSSGPA
ncbi:unnamed protein product [Phyllotreta striolata]|uniref:Major facilitator superfamily (MFS) profile domain-containing protein n=1 Tax=Phyllotreta striolata TaxID=444603 RepID=A0A9N9TG64_PHYSR|nr:unnamed protein product [Phyllotreta striolata]